MLSSILMNYYLSAGRTWLANLLTLCRSYELIVPCAWVLSRRMGAAATAFALNGVKRRPSGGRSPPA